MTAFAPIGFAPIAATTVATPGPAAAYGAAVAMGAAATVTRLAVATIAVAPLIVPGAKIVTSMAFGLGVVALEVATPLSHAAAGSSFAASGGSIAALSMIGGQAPGGFGVAAGVVATVYRQTLTAAFVLNAAPLISPLSGGSASASMQMTATAALLALASGQMLGGGVLQAALVGMASALEFEGQLGLVIDGGYEPAVQRNLTFTQGDTWTIDVRCRDGAGAPLDLDAARVECRFSLTNGVVDLSTAKGGIYWLERAEGLVRIELAPALQPPRSGRPGVYQVRVVLPDQTALTQLFGAINARPALF